MRRFHLCAAAVAIFSLHSAAQDQSYPYYEYNTTQFKSEDTHLFYRTFRGNPQVRSEEVFELQFFDEAFDRVNTHSIPLNEDFKMVANAAHNNGLLAYFADDEIGNLFVYNQNGEMLTSHQWEREEDEYNEVILASNREDGVLILRPHEEDEEGFMLTAYDNDFNTLWSASDFPEKGTITPKQILVNGDYIAAITEYKRSMFSNTYNHSAYVYHRKTGVKVYTAVLASDEDNCIPSNYVLNADGSLFSTGPVYDGDDLEGYFFKEYNPDGSSKFNTIQQVTDAFEQQLRSAHSEKIYMSRYEQPKLHIHDVISTGEGYRIVGETYAVQVGSKVEGSSDRPATFRVLDFVVFEVTNLGELSPIHTIAKPYKEIKYRVSSFSSDKNNAQYLQDAGLFSYRFMNGNEIVSMEWNQGNVYIGHTEITATEDNILKRVFIDKSIPESQSSPSVTTAKQQLNNIGRPEPFSFDILPINDGTGAVYYDYKYNEVQLTVVKGEGSLISGSEVENGRLAIPGIPKYQFSGVHALNDGSYYTFYMSERTSDKYRFVYHQLNADLSTAGRASIETPVDAQYVDIIERENDRVLVFQRKYDQELLFYVVSKLGEFSTSFSHKFGERDSIGLQTEPFLLEAGANFYIVQSSYSQLAKYQWYGYEVIKVTADNQIAWQHHQEGTNRNFLQISGAAANGDVLSLLDRETFHENREHPITSLRIFDELTGDLIATEVLEEGGHGVYPEYMEIDSEGRIVLGGQYFETQDVETDPVGPFIIGFDITGVEQFSHYNSWSQIEREISVWGQTEILNRSNTKLMAEELIELHSGEILVINELYSGGRSWSDYLGDNDGLVVFTTYDFVVYHYNHDGTLNDIYIISKPEQRIEMPEGLLKGSSMTLSIAMRSLKAFSYIKTEFEGATPYLVYQNTPDTLKVFRQELSKSISHNDFTIAKFAFPKDPNAEESSIDRFANRVERLSQQAEHSMEGIDYHYSELRNRLEGYTVGKNGAVLLYHFDPEKQILHLHLKNME